MKCLLCLNCGSLVQMKSEERVCDCGHVKGKYLANNVDIALKTSNIGQIRIIGIENAWLQESLKKVVSFPDELYGSEAQEGMKPYSLFIRQRCPIIVVFPFTTGDIKTYEEVGLE